MVIQFYENASLDNDWVEIAKKEVTLIYNNFFKLIMTEQSPILKVWNLVLITTMIMRMQITLLLMMTTKVDEPEGEEEIAGRLEQLRTLITDRF